MERVFMKGCEAIAEAAVRAGCRFFAGYPITPQNEIPEYFSRRLPEVNGVFMQGESEVAAVNMLMGGAVVGARGMTSSSSCGMALKSEGLSYMAQFRIPAVVCSVMRGGPGVGTIQPAQQDYFQATKASGNGGFHFMVFAPGNMQEAIDMTYQAFEYAEKYANPVMVLVDGFIAVMMEPVVLPEMKSEEELKAIRKAKEEWCATGRGPEMRDGRRANGLGSKLPASQEESNKLSAEMYELWAKTEVQVEELLVDDAELVIAAYGVSSRISESAIEELREQGYKVGMIRPKTVYPFPYENFRKLDPAKVKAVLDVEHSIPAQMVEDVAIGLQGRIPVETCLRSGGEILSVAQVVEAAKKILDK